VLRTDGYLYIDKTTLIYRLATTSLPYFLSRPRRFRKSLLISTFKAYFEGRKELEAGATEDFMERLNIFFAHIPYELNNNNEKHYQAVFYIVFTLMGQYIDVEVRSAKGRAGAVVKTKEAIYVFEFKLNGTAENAGQQMDDKGYLIPYQADNRKLVKVGVEFSKEERNIHRYIIN
jgi:hypothetical protein